MEEMAGALRIASASMQAACSAHHRIALCEIDRILEAYSRSLDHEGPAA